MDKSKIYIGHCRNSNYETELYKSLKESRLSEDYNLIFPHDSRYESLDSKEMLKEVDFMVAEVSYPATGLGIELGYASIYGVPIICVFKRGHKTARSLKRITDSFIEYGNADEMIQKLEEAIEDLRGNFIFGDKNECKE